MQTPPMSHPSGSTLPSPVVKLHHMYEQLYLERCVLESLLKESKVPEWEAKYTRAVNNPRLRAQNHTAFAGFALRLQHTANYEETLLELLAALSTGRKTNQNSSIRL